MSKLGMVCQLRMLHEISEMVRARVVHVVTGMTNKEVAQGSVEPVA
jgi:hypothetical protein